MKKEFISNVSKIQKELKAPKNQFNKFGGYKYRSCEDITEAVKQVLEPYGYVLVITDEIEVKADRFYVKATATITDGEDELKAVGYAREEQAKKGMDAPQITGATSSYARKYALNGLLCIDDAKDPDTDEYKKQQGGDIVSEDLKAKIGNASTIDEVKAIWDANQNLHKNSEFIFLISNKGKSYKK